MFAAAEVVSPEDYERGPRPGKVEFGQASVLATVGIGLTILSLIVENLWPKFKGKPEIDIDELDLLESGCE